MRPFLKYRNAHCREVDKTPIKRDNIKPNSNAIDYLIHSHILFIKIGNGNEGWTAVWPWQLANKLMKKRSLKTTPLVFCSPLYPIGKTKEGNDGSDSALVGHNFYPTKRALCMCHPTRISLVAIILGQKENGEW